MNKKKHTLIDINLDKIMAFSLFLIFVVSFPNFSKAELSVIPNEISKTCRNGIAKHYDECGSQEVLLEKAIQLAKKENKVVLISYGAEWCIWCQVFADYIKGKTTSFTHSYSDKNDLNKNTKTFFERQKSDVEADAKKLSSFVEKNFVLLHIDTRYSKGNGVNILRKTGSLHRYENWIPFIFTLDKRGKFAGNVGSRCCEVRRGGSDWFRGYDRKKLLKQLTKVYDRAVKVPKIIKEDNNGP